MLNIGTSLTIKRLTKLHLLKVRLPCMTQNLIVTIFNECRKLLFLDSTYFLVSGNSFLLCLHRAYHNFTFKCRDLTYRGINQILVCSRSRSSFF